MAIHLALCLLTFLTPSHAFWILPCATPLVIQRADPVISPGIVSGHVHTIMGGDGFSFSMDYASTQKSTCTSCKVSQDLSNYWVPQLYYKGQDGKFTFVGRNGGGVVYYLQRSDPLDPEYSKGLLAFPKGFRMVAGNPFQRSFNSSSLEAAGISYVCLGTSLAPNMNAFPNVNCPGGLRAQVFFPSCWDGVNLDSADHKSHMAYPSGTDSGHCPASHPKRFVSIFYEMVFNTPDFANMWYGNKQPFVWAMGDDTGYGFHGDFVNGWDVPTLQNAINTCNDPNGIIENCSVFKFQTDEVTNGCRIPSFVHEQVTGTLPTLPGCNPVTSGPNNAVQQTGCGATTNIGTPQFPYTDVTKSKGFKYLGCGFDFAGQARTLGGAAKTDGTGMTVESCIDFCTSSGYSIAGLEYSTQCFCGNSYTADRAPIAGLLGSCDMPCSGNSAEICGGSAVISLYQKCANSSSCANIQYPFSSGMSKERKLSRRERRQASAVCLANITILSITSSTSSVPQSSTENSSLSSISSSSLPISSSSNSSSSTDNSTGPSTPIATSVNSSISVTVPSTALATTTINNPFGNVCYEDGCLRAFEAFTATEFCSNWLATTNAPTVTLPTSLPLGGCDFAPGAVYHVSSGCSCYQKTASV